MTGASPSLDAVAALVPFLRARRDEPEPGDLRSADLIEPDELAKAVSASAAVRGSEDPQVLASLWWQGYAYRVAGSTLAAWVVAGTAPDPTLATGIGVGIGRGRPSSLVVGTAAEELDELPTIVHQLFTGHLDPLAASLRARHAIGERLVWGNTAASIASCLGAVACSDGAGAGIGPRIDEVTAVLPHDLGALGEWTVRHSSYRRTTCCLWWKTTASAGALCEDCSLR